MCRERWLIRAGWPCAYDPDAAKALVAQAFPGGGVPTVEVDTDDDPTDVALANAVQASLVAIGVPANVVVKPFAEYQRFVTTGQTQLFRTGGWGWPRARGRTSTRCSGRTRSTTSPEWLRPSWTPVWARRWPPRTMPHAWPSTRRWRRTSWPCLPLVPIGSYVASVRLSGGVQNYVQRLDGTFDLLQVQVASS